LVGPWTALPRHFAVEARKEQTTLALEIVREIRQQVPAFSRPLSGPFGAGIQHGVETALAEFADRIDGTDRLSADRLRVYRSLGRGELAEGRSLDALQAAYRLGARVAWRRYARVARRTGMSPDLMVTLAEAIFAHIDQLASASVQGYIDAKADEADQADGDGLLGRRRRLLELLLAGAPLPAVEQAAAAAGWPVPAELACVVLDPAVPAVPAAPGGPRRYRLPDAVLADLDRDDPYLLVPEPALLLEDDRVRRLLRGRNAVIGPRVPARLAADSLRWARSVRAGLPDGGSGGGSGGGSDGPLDCDRHLPDLLLFADGALVRLIEVRRLGPLAALTPKQSERLGATLLAWLQTNRGSAPEVAERLGIHPQTARQRLHRVQHLFGPALSDPDARFELEIALRGRELRAALSPY
jgi:hypothetical protein